MASVAETVLKSVSLFIVRGRRSAHKSPSPSTAASPKKKMAEKGPRKGPANVLESLRKRTHFSRQELESLSKIFRKLANGGTMDRATFREVLHNTFDMTEDLLMDRVFCAFDKTSQGSLGMEQWVCGLSVFLKGSQDEKVAYCFAVYDLNGDGYITREEMFNLLRDTLVRQPQDEDPDEGVRDLVDITLKKMDYDGDGKVSFEDYKRTVHEEPLLLEAFGHCLPQEKTCRTFISTL